MKRFDLWKRFLLLRSVYGRHDRVHALLVLSCMAVAAVAVPAQEVSSFTREQMLTRAKSLRAEARGSATGLAFVILERYPNSYIELVARVGSGHSELHEHWADFFIPVEGTADVVTGGTMIDGKTTGPGEIRGREVRGGNITRSSPVMGCTSIREYRTRRWSPPARPSSTW